MRTNTVRHYSYIIDVDYKINKHFKLIINFTVHVIICIYRTIWQFRQEWRQIFKIIVRCTTNWMNFYRFFIRLNTMLSWHVCREHEKVEEDVCQWRLKKHLLNTKYKILRPIVFIWDIKCTVPTSKTKRKYY